MDSRSNLLLLSLIFLISILVRLPNVDRPLSSNYEWVTAHTLVTLNIWDEEGIINHSFNPIYTFSNPNDHHIKCPISGVSTESGDYYYVSYPPFAFIFPFLVFKTLNLSFTPLALQVFNIFLHFVCAGVLYLLLTSLISTKKSKTNYAAILGTSIYVLCPINLWNHSNVYFADILVQLFFLLTLYFTNRYLTNKKTQKTTIPFLCLSLFLMIYTEWLGLLMALCLGLFSLLKKRFHLFLWVTLTSLLSITLILVQYSSIAGLETYLDTLLNRYTERSGQFGRAQIYQLDSHLFLLQMYLRNFFPYLIILAFTLALPPLITRKYNFSIPRLAWPIMALSLAPVILHHLFLFEFTIIHELSLVKSSVFIAIAISVLSTRTFSEITRKNYTVERSLYLFVLASMFSLGVYFYYSHIITPQEYASLRLGNQIKQTSSHDDTIFFKSNQTYGDFLIKAPLNFVIAPQIQYYAGRCIQVVPGTAEALQHLRTYNKSEGIIYTIENPFYRIESIEHVYNTEDFQNQEN